MNLTLERKFGNENDPNAERYGTIYKTDETIQMGNFCSLLESLENDKNKFYFCRVSEYDKDGVLGFPTFKSLEDLKEFKSDPGSSLHAVFVRTDNNNYSFSVMSSINSKDIRISYLKATYNEVKRRLENEKILEELKKNRAKAKEEMERMNEEAKADVEKMKEDINKDIGGNFHK